MADHLLEPPGEIVTFPNGFPPMPAVARILSRFDRAQLAGFIAVAIDLADAMDGDPDGEDDDPAEAAGDERDGAWIEWHAMRGSQKRGPNIASHNEDDEDDDPAEEDDDPAQYTEDEISCALHAYGFYAPGPGCPISDPAETSGTLRKPVYGSDQTRPEPCGLRNGKEPDEMPVA